MIAAMYVSSDNVDIGLIGLEMKGQPLEQLKGITVSTDMYARSLAFVKNRYRWSETMSGSLYVKFIKSIAGKHTKMLLRLEKHRRIAKVDSSQIETCIWLL